jgi:hypothetical protein
MDMTSFGVFFIETFRQCHKKFRLNKTLKSVFRSIFECHKTNINHNNNMPIRLNIGNNDEDDGGGDGGDDDGDQGS